MLICKQAFHLFMDAMCHCREALRKPRRRAPLIEEVGSAPELKPHGSEDRQSEQEVEKMAPSDFVRRALPLLFSPKVVPASSLSPEFHRSPPANQSLLIQLTIVSILVGISSLYWGMPTQNTNFAKVKSVLIVRDFKQKQEHCCMLSIGNSELQGACRPVPLDRTCLSTLNCWRPGGEHWPIWQARRSSSAVPSPRQFLSASHPIPPWICALALHLILFLLRFALLLCFGIFVLFTTFQL